MSERPNNYDIEVVTGPCSVDLELKRNLSGYYNLADMRVRNMHGEMQRGVYGTRVVPLKSRTIVKKDGTGMGVDFKHYFTVEEDIVVIRNPLPVDPPPGVVAAERIVKDTGLLVATEIMMPHIQLPYYENRIPSGKFLEWQPSVEGLGYPHLTMGEYARRNGWLHGIKNPKNLDVPLDTANNSDENVSSALQRQWSGLASFAQIPGNQIIFIHRGVDSPENRTWRSAPVHEIARKTKHSVPGAKLYFDPSHSCGPKLRDKVVETTIAAMKMQDGNNWLYDGILIEAGNSITDTDQHISHEELQCLLDELAKFRNLREPEAIEPKIHQGVRF